MSRKVYDLDENGQKIRLPSGNWKSHKEDTVDWNDRKYAEIWRHEWEIADEEAVERELRMSSKNDSLSESEIIERSISVDNERIRELDSPTLNRLVNVIVIHEDFDGESIRQTVEIHWNFKGTGRLSDRG